MRITIGNNWRGLKTINTDVYAPMLGFKNLDEFLEAARLTGKWHKIKVPTFCLTSTDDQICPDSIITPYKEV